MQLTRNGVQRDLDYDSMDHVTRVVEGGIEVERYTFDGAGRRVSANNGTGVRKFVTAPSIGDGYDSPQAVTDGSGNLLAAFVYSGGDEPFMKITPTGVEYLLTDSMGSVVGKADASGGSTATFK